MRKLAKPIDDPKISFLTCISGVTDSDLKMRLSDVADFVASAATDFENKVVLNELYTLKRNKSTKANKCLHVIGDKVTINEMKDVYTSYFAAKDSLGREIYDRILSIPINSRCPYCFHRIVSTIDHYLPKAHYPLLSVVPANLVPSCKDCNLDSKKTTYPKKSTDEILHPYFDNIENELWLKAKVVHTNPAMLTFFVAPPSSWDDILEARVRTHFDTLALDSLYGSEAANELCNIRYQLELEFSNGGANAVRSNLQKSAQSRRKANINSWQTAMYTAISNSQWFCEGGFI